MMGITPVWVFAEKEAKAESITNVTTGAFPVCLFYPLLFGAKPMNTYAAYVQDPFVQFCLATPDLSNLEQRVLWFVQQLSEISGRLSMADIAAAAQVSRTSVESVVRKFRNRGLSFFGELGRVGIFRVNMKCLCKDSPTQTASTPAQELSGQPTQTAGTPDAPNLCPLPERDLKASLTPLNRNLKGKGYAFKTPSPSLSSQIGEKEKAEIRNVVAQFHELRGVKMTQPPGLPEAEPCLRIMAALRDWGPEKCGYLLLSHFHEMGQDKKRGKYKPHWDRIENAFMPARENGKWIPTKLDREWAVQRIEEGEKIAKAKEIRAQEREREQRRERQVLRGPSDLKSVLAECKKAIAMGAKYVAQAGG